MLVLALNVNLSDARPPDWVRSLAGCNYKWDGPATIVVNGDGTCSFSRSMSSTSWLWHCSKVTYTWGPAPCIANPGDATGDAVPPDFDINDEDARNRESISSNFITISKSGVPVNPDFMDVEKLKDPFIRRADLTFRLYLAGYTYNPIWETLTQDPCPVPQPTNPLIVPQAYNYVNLNCTPLNVNPSPTTGLITIDLSQIVNNVTQLTILNSTNGAIIYETNAVGSIFTYNMTDQLPGVYLIRVTTTTGLITTYFIKI